ncbi:MAG: hypothetical protein OEW12_08380, partial [Deltaproteobacteria bacterium]|nr:hypothetical protein [Deltaproteobacteria bacterium]
MNRTFSGLWSRVAARMAAAPPEGDKTGEAAPPVWVNRWGWRMVLALWGGLLAVFTGYRLVFYWMYHPVFAGFGAGDVALAFLHGVRFDLAVILTFTGLPVWAAFAASPWRRRRGMFWVVVLATAVVFLPVFVLMGVDLFY